MGTNAAGYGRSFERFGVISNNGESWMFSCSDDVSRHLASETGELLTFFDQQMSFTRGPGMADRLNARIWTSEGTKYSFAERESDAVPGGGLTGVCFSGGERGR